MKQVFGGGEGGFWNVPDFAIKTYQLKSAKIPCKSKKIEKLMRIRDKWGGFPRVCNKKYELTSPIHESGKPKNATTMYCITKVAKFIIFLNLTAGFESRKGFLLVTSNLFLNLFYRT